VSGTRNHTEHDFENPCPSEDEEKGGMFDFLSYAGVYAHSIVSVLHYKSPWALPLEIKNIKIDLVIDHF
jgi:hypothetical protein